MAQMPQKGDNSFYINLRKWIFCLIQHSRRLIKADLFYIYANVLKYLIQTLAEVTESNCTMMWESLFDQHMTVETSHLGWMKLHGR